MKFGQDLTEHEDIARKCKILRLKIKEYQESFNAIEKVVYYNFFLIYYYII